MTSSYRPAIFFKTAVFVLSQLEIKKKPYILSHTAFQSSQMTVPLKPL
jgi:hypothetical protein